MHTSVLEVRVPDAGEITMTEDTLTAELSDGRTISVPLAWYPRLVHATEHERGNWRLTRRGRGHPLARPRRGHQRGRAARGPGFGREPTVASSDGLKTKRDGRNLGIHRVPPRDPEQGGP